MGTEPPAEHWGWRAQPGLETTGLKAWQKGSPPEGSCSAPSLRTTWMTAAVTIPFCKFRAWGFPCLELHAGSGGTEVVVPTCLPLDLDVRAHTHTLTLGSVGIWCLFSGRTCLSLLSSQGSPLLLSSNFSGVPTVASCLRPRSSELGALVFQEFTGPAEQEAGRLPHDPGVSCS